MVSPERGFCLIKIARSPSDVNATKAVEVLTLTDGEAIPYQNRPVPENGLLGMWLEASASRGSHFQSGI